MRHNGGTLSRHAPRSERALARVPSSLIEYPYEILVAAWGFLAGIAGLVRFASSSTISTLLPPWASMLWSVSLALSGVTIAVGLWKHRYGTQVANGLILHSIATGVYGLALATVGGRPATYAASLLFVVSTLDALRALYFRVRRSMSKRMEQARFVTEAVGVEKERKRSTP